MTTTAIVPGAPTNVMGRRARPWHRQQEFHREPPPAWGPDAAAGEDDSGEEEPPADREPAITPDPLTGSGGTEGAWGQILSRLEPGPVLAAELERITADSVDEYDLVEMVAGYARIAAWAQARMVEVAGDLSRRPALNPRMVLPGGGEYATNVAAEELAPRLGLSRFAAKRIVTNAREFRRELAATGEALRAGEIDYSKACTMVRLLADHPAEVAVEVQEHVLPRAGHMSHTELTRAVQKAIIAIDPDHATARCREARARRRVDHPRPLPDGMSSIFAILPATDAAGLDLALEGAARHARAAGDERTLDQLRADTLALLGHAALDRGFVGLAPPDQVPLGPAPPDASPPGLAPPDASPLAPENAPPVDDPGAGLSPTTRWLLGYEDPPPHDDPDLAPMMQTGGSYRRTLHMPVGGIGGSRTQIRVTVPLSVLIRPGLRDPRSHDPGECSAHDDATDPSDCACCAGGAAEGSGDGIVDEPAWPGAQMAEVAELEGYGAITPDIARALAATGTTWQRLVTDPLSGALLDVGRTRYKPPAAIAEFVRHRDGTCVRPGCSAPARGCELDHIVPWEEGGVTAVGNLGPMCGRDHRTKTVGAFVLEHLGNGTFEWTTPSGHRYRRDRQGRVTMAPPRRYGPDSGDPPPF